MDPINVMDSDLGNKTVRITDLQFNCSRTADLSMAASTDLAMKLRGSADPVPPFQPPPPPLDNWCPASDYHFWRLSHVNLFCFDLYSPCVNGILAKTYY